MKEEKGGKEEKLKKGRDAARVITSSQTITQHQCGTAPFDVSFIYNARVGVLPTIPEGAIVSIKFNSTRSAVALLYRYCAHSSITSRAGRFSNVATTYRTATAALLLCCCCLEQGTKQIANI